MKITPENYQFLSACLRKETGIELGSGREYLAESRLSELCQQYALTSINELIRTMRQGKPGVARSVMEALTTNETYFFRDEPAYAALRGTILPALLAQRAAQKELRIWSAACSTGQEPYSLAIMLEESFPQLKGWKVSILATDIAEEKVLERAREGRYLDHEVKRGLTQQQLFSHFERMGGGWLINPHFRRTVSFRRVNLLEVPPTVAEFDLILCRNVLIYFDLDTKRQVLNTLVDRLTPQGFLVVGGSEVLFGVTDRVRRESDASKASFYRRTL